MHVTVAINLYQSHHQGQHSDKRNVCYDIVDTIWFFFKTKSYLCVWMSGPNFWGVAILCKNYWDYFFFYVVNEHDIVSICCWWHIFFLIFSLITRILPCQGLALMLSSSMFFFFHSFLSSRMFLSCGAGHYWKQLFFFFWKRGSVCDTIYAFVFLQDCSAISVWSKKTICNGVSSSLYCDDG